jgi:hypothetical protein
MLHRVREMINDLILSYNSIALNIFSIPGDKSGDPQNDILDDDLPLLLLLSSWLFMPLGFL